MNPTDPADQNIPERHTPSVPPAPASSSDTCDRLRPELKAFADGQLGWLRRQVVSQHIAHCDACREEMQAMREFSAKWREVDGETLDPGLRARILAAVPDTMPDAPQTASRNVPRRRPLIFVGAAASTALIAGVAVSLFSPRANRLADSSSQSVSSVAKPPASVAAPEAAASQASAVPESQQTAATGAATPLASGAAQKRSQIASAKPVAGGAAYSRAMPPQPAQVQKDAAKEAYAAAGTTAPNMALPGSGQSGEYDAPGAAKQDRSTGQSTADGVGAGGQALRRDPTVAAPAPPTAAAGESHSAALPPEEQTASAPGSAPPSAPKKASGAAATLAAPSQRAGAALKSNAAFGRAHALASPDAVTPAAAVTLYLEADKMEQTGAAIEREAANVGGSVVNSDLTTNSQNTKSATLKLRIPAARLKAFLDYAAQLGDKPAGQADKTAKDGNGNTAQEEKPAIAQNAQRKPATTDLIIRLKTRTP